MTTPNRKPLLKLVMIPVLITVLGIRLVGMTGSSDLSDAPQNLAADSKSDPVPGIEDALAQLTNWPMRSLQEIKEYDPFSKPREQQPEVTAQVEAPTETAAPIKFDPQSIDLKMIYHTGDEVVALVGTRIVKAGDRLDDGSLVESIGEQEIVIRPPGQAD